MQYIVMYSVNAVFSIRNDIHYMCVSNVINVMASNVKILMQCVNVLLCLLYMSILMANEEINSNVKVMCRQPVIIINEIQ